ncbi:hypothetical protein HXA35_13710 [Bacillus sp. A301a_S52]|nr:hypothetical protein [Bacillus sp. A301a_S52]
MSKKICWIIIFITIAINVAMVQWTVESYLGREYEKVIIFSAIGVVGAFIAFFAYLNWRKIEYTHSSKK